MFSVEWSDCIIYLHNKWYNIEMVKYSKNVKKRVLRNFDDIKL